MKTAQRSYQAKKEQIDAMEQEEVINTITKTEVENMVKPLQIPEEPIKLKLDQDWSKPEAGTKKLAQSLNPTEGRGACYHGYPAPLTVKTKAETRAEPFQLPEEPKGLKMGKVKPDAEAGTTPKMVPPPNTTEGRGPVTTGNGQEAEDERNQAQNQG